MLYYPQLVSAAVAQYPLSKERRVRTLVNATSEDRRVTFSDIGDSRTLWNLYYSGLTAVERDRIEQLFSACEGRLRPFHFADPTRNLLARSEDLDQSPWSSGQMLQWTSGLSDPFGGTGARGLLNSGSTAQSVAQPLELPGTYACSFSVFARAATAVSVELARVGGSERKSSAYALTPAWQRIQFFSALADATSPSQFEIAIAGGDAVELFGAQVDAQPWASDYWRTGTSNGVYANARFAEDELAVLAEGIDSYAARVAIVVAGEGS
jgi:hypothetical protein